MSASAPRLLRLAAGAATLASAALLVAAYALPTVTFQRLASASETYSIWGGIASLWEDGNWILAAIVFLFSMVWPNAKLATLAWLQLAPHPERRRRTVLGWLRQLGRWSMLDVFVVGIFVGSIRFGFLAQGSSRAGIHLFAVAILLSMAAALLLDRLDAPDPPPRVARPTWLARASSLAAATGVGASIALASVQIEKAFFFRNQVHLVPTAERLAEEGELLVALPLWAFVIVAPCLRALASLALRTSPARPTWLVRTALLADEWAMLDVFALAMLIVYSKLAQLATTTPLLGFWVLVATAAATNLDAWLLRRAVRQERREGPIRA